MVTLPVSLWGVGTPDDCQNSQPPELPTNQPEKTKEISMLGKYRTRPVLPDQQHQVSSFVSQTLKTYMGWLEHLWMIIYQHDASLLIVWHTY
jgi:hypothetical protein